MADTKITVGIDLEDDLTPKLNEVKGAVEGLGKNISGAKIGEGERGGGFMAEQMKELTAGIGYQFGLWNLGFMGAQKLGDALGEVMKDVEVYSQLTNRMAGTNEDATTSFVQLSMAALASGTSISETAKRVDELMVKTGMGRGAATQAAISIGQLRERTGIDIGQAFEAAKMLRLSPEQGVQMAMAGGPFARLGPESRAAQGEEAERPYREQQMSWNRTMEERDFEQKTHNIERVTRLNNIALSQEMEDRQRLENRSMEATHYRISIQTEETNRSINREMEDRHRAINEEMQDRHRAADYAMQDEERIHSRRIGLMSGTKGVMDMAFRATMGGRTPRGPIGDMADALAKEMEKGERQLEKDLGLARGEAEELVKSGAMSPQALLQEAQAAREERIIEERREMELEAIQEERKQRLELLAEERRQQDQLHQMQVDFHNQEVTQSQQHEDQRIQFERQLQAQEMQHAEDVYQARKALDEKYQNDVLQLESDRINAQLKRSEDAIDAEEEYAKGAYERAAASINQIILAAIGITLPQGGKGGAAAAPSTGATEATAQDTNRILSDLTNTLSRVLSGG